MLALAKQIITDTAVAAGLAAGSIMDKPKKESKVLYPKPRIEFSGFEESLLPGTGLFCKLPAAEPDKYITHRRRIRRRILKVRLTIIADDETWLEEFLSDFLKGLPRKAADSDNNLVTIKAERAVRGGFEDALVEVFKRCEIAILITFSGGVYRDIDVPWIRGDINLKDGITTTGDRPVAPTF